MYCVLVVDDVAENIDILTGILKDEYIVKAAVNGKMALKVAEKTLPDLILLDIMMPEMDGYEVCHLLKKNPFTSHIPVIFVTTRDQENDELKGFESGAVDYINKPVNPLIVKARIKTHIALSDQKKALEMDVAAKTKEINDTRLQIIKKLGHAAEYKDNDTGLHIERMSRYSHLIAQKFGFAPHQSELILHASPMHDIGKIGIPDAVLQKPGKFDPREWEIMATHALIGGDIIGESDVELLNIAKIIAEQHHEKWNGQGYPKKLSGQEINIFARIVAIADVFDALTSKRPYKKAWSVEQAFELIRSEKEKHFDPDVVDAFEQGLPELIKIKNHFQ
ncbi:response regulator [Heliorestis acidaminivorans]|uniref:Stage 0 sporulation protein A homolog n=1 Tax=Heliorestis acidaminivorans TaxID=553427 RepID=A0A6I0EUM0_9FIRM|nr:HD domain-containing phosphohydrolase [Heliorestis acidaminivorans]KAB2953894.1 response regulator [Heliorestis acidaminivorans]